MYAEVDDDGEIIILQSALRFIIYTTIMSLIKVRSIHCHYFYWVRLLVFGDWVWFSDRNTDDSRGPT